ncbi:hypothetical protein [Photobacterium lutimaris]|uniref:Uncharacterized protein n=1 Tax=Photobacterium lutimaris TaxID=388278 RepID=A0A2T3ITK3_9GAMM|nr:hypothetical protein [Photobacterium lutimaris]PSU31672.1 hypothetical protein C9I99_21020 [Photobacterium lutimaris]TDR72692.1 hypothetical protein DFP78_113168 [Photobacterium lutimaris]
MIKCVARPINPNEPCLLVDNEFKPLNIKDEDNHVQHTIPAPSSGWDYNALEKACINVPGLSNEIAYCAYLGQQWVGSTEI